MKAKKMKPKALLLFALLMGGCLFLSGCMGGAGPRGWSGPVVANESLYVGTMDGRVVAINSSSRIAGRSFPQESEGEWSRPFGGGGGGGFLSCVPAVTVSFYGSPAVADGIVFIGADNGGVYALNPSSRIAGHTFPQESEGEWIYPDPAEGPLGSIMGSPVVTEGILYVGSADGNLYAINTTTGRLVWGFETGDDIWATPTVHDGVVYIGSFDHKLYALNATDGTLVWESPFEAGGAIAATSLIYNDTIYIGSCDRMFYAVNASTGEAKEGFTPFQGGNWFWGKAVAYDDTIIVGCLDGRVYAIDAESGVEVWAPYEAGGAIRGDPALVGDLVIFGSEDGRVYALDAGSGAERWHKTLVDPPAKTEVRASIGAGEGVVYVHATNQKIYALETEHGDVLWSFSAGD